MCKHGQDQPAVYTLLLTVLRLLYAVVLCCSTVCTCFTQYCALRRH